jgi:hypothetical protein
MEDHSPSWVAGNGMKSGGGRAHPCAPAPRMSDDLPPISFPSCAAGWTLGLPERPHKNVLARRAQHGSTQPHTTSSSLLSGSTQGVAGSIGLHANLFPGKASCWCYT